MNCAVLGTGNVGRTIASRLHELGHAVCLGSRTADNVAATAWAAEAGGSATHGTFGDAAAFGHIAINCTPGIHSVAVLRECAEHLRGKVLVDVSNPLDFSQGFPPRLTVCNDDSVAEQIQRALPDARVVKTLNTMAVEVMVNPARVPGAHDVFLSGDDEAAKQTVRQLLDSFGWTDPIDLGDLSTARGVEMFLPLWVRLYGVLGSGDFQIRVVRGI